MLFCTIVERKCDARVHVRRHAREPLHQSRFDASQGAYQRTVESSGRALSVPVTLELMPKCGTQIAPTLEAGLTSSIELHSYQRELDGVTFTWCAFKYVRKTIDKISLVLGKSSTTPP